MSKPSKESSNPRAGLKDRLRFLFNGVQPAQPVQIGQESALDPDEALRAQNLTHEQYQARILKAITYSSPPDLETIKRIARVAPEALQQPFILKGMTIGGRYPEMPWLCYVTAEKDASDVLSFLIENGAVLDARDSNLCKGDALHWAAKHGNSKAAEILVAAGSNVEDTNNLLGKKASDTARYYGHIDLADWLAGHERLTPRIPDRRMAGPTTSQWIKAPKTRVRFGD